MWLSIATTAVPTFGTEELTFFLWLFWSNFEFSFVLTFAKNMFLTQELFKAIFPSLKYNLFLEFAYQYPKKSLLL